MSTDRTRKDRGGTSTDPSWVWDGPDRARQSRRRLRNTSFRRPGHWPRLAGLKIRQIGRAVAVEHTFEVAVGRAARVASIALVGLGEVNAIGVFRFVSVDDDVALVVVALADEPGKDASRIGRIADAALPRLAVPGGDVVLGDGAPEGVLRVREIHPAFDAGEQALDSRSITVDAVLLAVDGVRWVIPHAPTGRCS